MVVIKSEHLFRMRGAMFSASGVVQDNSFTKHPCARGVWYVAASGDRASNIFFSGTNKEGMAGRTLSFKLTDGTVDLVEGPWMGNTDELYKDTGVDLRDKHLMRYVICRELTHNGPEVYCKDVLALVDEPSEMTYSECTELAQKMANTLNERLRYAYESSGGSCIGYVKPEGAV